MHLSIILAVDQIDAQVLAFLVSLLYSSTCFEHCCAHHQEVKLYYTASVSSHSVGGRSVRTCAPEGHLQEYVH